MDLVAATVTITLPNGLPQLVVVGASLSKVLAEQVSPFGGSGRDRWDDQGDTTRAGSRGMKPDSSLASRAVSFGCTKSIFDYNISVILEL